MLTARQNAYLRSLVTASIQKADRAATANFPDPREKQPTRPTVTTPKPRPDVPRYVVQSFRGPVPACEPFGDLTFAMRHASLNAPSNVWAFADVTIRDGQVFHPKSAKPLAKYA
ncbi:hypothetical protein [Bradyrhizobium sp. SZCCHNR3118]|uniref:hypothetical protein n=1 Tax=Bradyrhizobium sp. SZCCHNR3118 TaxID=3057468 RepID=UPI002916498D|nr:hypothetical protein [Bradyrhizobium sp. SZCCHNR3118]